MVYFYNFDFLFYIYVFCYCYKQFTELYYSCLAVVALFAAAFIVAACAGGIV